VLTAGTLIPSATVATAHDKGNGKPHSATADSRLPEGFTEQKQFGFFLLKNGLPEQAVDGREEEWVQGFTDQIEVVKDGVDEADVKVFAKYLKDDSHLRASFEWFRAFPTDIADNAVYKKTKSPMPVLAIGASDSLGSFVGTQAEGYATNVTSVVIANSGHWIYEEHPEEMAQRLLAFFR
jgi:pimeloyl-ACP methyl ester carboxylesterase